MDWWLYEWRVRLREYLTDFGLWLVRSVNRGKDRRLAERLHRLASDYQSRPAEGWQPPPTDEE